MREKRIPRPRAAATAVACLLLAGGAWSEGGSQVVAGSPNSEIAFDVAWDGVDFLVVLEGSAAGDSQVAAQLVAPDGSLVGGSIALSGSGGYPLVEFDGTNYLLAWSDGANFPNDDMMAQFVDTSGVPGSPISVSSAAQTESRAGLAFDGTSYLVTYYREVAGSPGSDRLYGRLVSTAGTVGSEVQISSGLADHAHDALVFGGGQYLAVWVDDGNDDDVWARFVDTSGVPGTEFLVDASGWPSDNPATVGFGAGLYLVIWSEEVGGPGTGEWDLMGRLVDSTGTLLGSPITIAGDPGAQILPFVAFDGSNFLVTWTDLSNDLDGQFDCDPGEGTCADVHGRFVDTAGNAVGDVWPIVAEPGMQFVSPLVFDGGRYFMAWGSEPVPGAKTDVLAGFVPATGFPQSYCTAKTNSQGCLPAVTFAGIPSATSPSAFDLGATDTLNNRAGLLFYGQFGPAASPFFGGTLCVAPPLRRTPIQFSGGNPPPADCSGGYAFDFNAWFQSGADPFLGPGASVNAQYWMRDPAHPDGTGVALSNAVGFTVCP